jgi:predicted RNase H-like HicB family nuclease
MSPLPFGERIRVRGAAVPLSPWEEHSLTGRGEGYLKSRRTMKLQITIYQDETGMYVVECPVIPGCVSQGKTEAEALENIREAIAACLEVRREEGLPLTVETRTVEIPT